MTFHTSPFGICHYHSTLTMHDSAESAVCVALINSFSLCVQSSHEIHSRHRSSSNRPVCVLTFRVNAKLSKHFGCEHDDWRQCSTFAWHLVNIVLHLANTLLFLHFVAAVTDPAFAEPPIEDGRTTVEVQDTEDNRRRRMVPVVLRVCQPMFVCIMHACIDVCEPRAHIALKNTCLHIPTDSGAFLCLSSHPFGSSCLACRQGRRALRLFFPRRLSSLLCLCSRCRRTRGHAVTRCRHAHSRVGCSGFGYVFQGNGNHRLAAHVGVGCLALSPAAPAPQSPAPHRSCSAGSMGSAGEVLPIFCQGSGYGCGDGGACRLPVTSQRHQFAGISRA